MYNLRPIYDKIIIVIISEFIFGGIFMIFASYGFLLFFAIVMLGFITLNKLKLQLISELWLILSSFYFYAQGSIAFLPYFIGTVFFNYIIGFMILNQEGDYALRNRKVLLCLGIAENVLLLGYFKYTNFLIANFNLLTGQAMPLRNIILPIGISFFTFQLIAYLVDCYRGETKEYTVTNYLLFITFFPQLIVGPIVHHKDIVPQFEEGKQFNLNMRNIMLGILIFAIGSAKKTLLADPLTGYAQEFFNNVYVGGLWETWTSVFAYTFSYYFDLSGYADMAIGLGLFFNINLPQNFNSPYKARNFRDYWRRWHMTLSKFLSDYVFRSIYKKGNTTFRFYMAVMTTFLVSGFWHGAGWRFVLWGIINGIFVCFAHILTRRKWKLPFALAWTLTFAGILGTRVIFVSNRIKDALYVYRSLFDFTEFSGMTFTAILSDGGRFLVFNLYIITVLLVGMAIAFFAANTEEIAEGFKPGFKYAIMAGVLLMISFIQMTSVSKFLYFQF